MRLYTKKLHAKSPVAARITYSVRDYENTRGVAEGTRNVFSPSAISVASPSPSFLRTPPAVPSPSTNPVLFARAIPIGSLFLRRESNVNRAASTVSPIGRSQRNRKHIRSLFTCDFSLVSVQDSGCLIKISSCETTERENEIVY